MTVSATDTGSTADVSPFAQQLSWMQGEERQELNERLERLESEAKNLISTRSAIRMRLGLPTAEDTPWSLTTSSLPTFGPSPPAEPTGETTPASRSAPMKRRALPKSTPQPPEAGAITHPTQGHALPHPPLPDGHAAALAQAAEKATALA
eukprot:5032138-Prymnesium_polylepis.1